MNVNKEMDEEQQGQSNGQTNNSLPHIQNSYENGIHRHSPRRALNGSYQFIRFVPDDKHILPRDFFYAVMSMLRQTCETLITQCRYCKIHPVLTLRMCQIDPSTGKVRRREVKKISLHASTLSDFHLEESIEKFEEIVGRMNTNGSNWIVEGVDSFDLSIVRFEPRPETRGLYKRRVRSAVDQRMDPIETKVLQHEVN